MPNNFRKLILVIDDSTDNQDLLKLLLIDKGYDVYCVSNGSEALSLLSELSDLPDLILLDAQMPVMDGYQFRRVQSRNDRIKDIPVVVMTAETDLELNRHMMRPEGILLKPLDINSVIENVAHFS